jgi:hypothetical protein
VAEDGSLGRIGADVVLDSLELGKQVGEVRSSGRSLKFALGIHLVERLVEDRECSAHPTFEQRWDRDGGPRVPIFIIGDSAGQIEDRGTNEVPARSTVSPSHRGERPPRVGSEMHRKMAVEIDDAIARRTRGALRNPVRAVLGLAHDDLGR